MNVSAAGAEGEMFLAHASLPPCSHEWLHTRKRGFCSEKEKTNINFMKLCYRLNNLKSERKNERDGIFSTRRISPGLRQRWGSFTNASHVCLLEIDLF